MLTEVFAPSEVEKTVPPLDLVLVCWRYSEVEDFHSESVVAVVARVKFVSVVGMCFCAECGQYDLSLFFASPYEKKGSILGGSFVIEIMSQMA